VPVDDIRSLITAAWALDELAGKYRDFTIWVTGLAPVTSTETFTAQVGLVHEWRRFPFLDPDLPSSLLPPDWPARQALDAFVDRHALWRATAQAQWDTWVGE
jgi:phenylacetic acid degradation operon negative regulatory protein